MRFRKHESYTQNCHFLVVNKPIYAHLAIYAITSLLYFNRHIKVIIHCDFECSKVLNRKLWILFGKSIFVNVIDTENPDPMFEKAKLLLSLQGTKDIFLDADTRVNGLIPQFSKPAVLVKEFDIEDSPIWQSIVNELNLGSVHIQMLNTTFFTWAGFDLGINLERFKTFYSVYHNINWEKIDSLNFETRNYRRLVEQFFFSIVLSQNGFFTLKEKDLVADKGIIESSYFGASGYRFGR